MRRLSFVAGAGDAGSAGQAGELTVVLDTAWTPRPGARPDVISLRPAFAAAMERHDLYGEALAALERWATEADLADRLVVEDVTYWYRVREELWRWTHERLLWQHAIASIEADGAFDAVAVPWDETALIDVVRALGRRVEVTGAPPTSVSPAGETSWRRFVPSAAVRVVRRFRPRARPPSAVGGPPPDASFDARLERLTASAGPRVLVLTRPNRFQPVGGEDARLDPNLGAVIPALREAGFEPILIGLGMSRRRDEDRLAAERDDRLLPAYYLGSRFGRPEDGRRATDAVEIVGGGLDGLTVPFVLAGLDLTAALMGALRDSLARVVRVDMLERARVERLLEIVRPAAILMTQEGHRTGWLAAAARARVASFALQHGILYPTHPGYADRRHPNLVLPTRTFVFGDYERRVLEGLAYDPGEVIVAGSPRLDLDAAAPARPDPVAERLAVRGELGVADGDRLLVVSTMNVAFLRRSHLVHMLEVLLGGPLPGIHVVVKLHPGEDDDGPARPLLTGLATAGRYAPPPITIVKDTDLYRLLRAADAHLGQLSTVLTDAVIAGTTNLIAMVEGSADLLGYVAAGVARPVRDIAGLRAALHDPQPVRPDDRRAFLDDHFLPGTASTRIATAMATVVRERSDADPVGAR